MRLGGQVSWRHLLDQTHPTEMQANMDPSRKIDGMMNMMMFVIGRGSSCGC